MLRRDLEIQRRMAEETQFVTKVANLPAVNSAWTTVSDLYQKSKDRSDLLRYTLGVAEIGVKAVAVTAQPLIARYEDPLKKVNAYACDKLDQLTTTYPIFTKPTDEVVSEGKELIQPAIATVTAIKDLGVGAYNTVNDVKQYGIDTVVGVATYGKDTVIGVTNYGKDAVLGVTNYGKDAVLGVTNYGKDTVIGVTNYGKDTVIGVTNYGKDKLYKATAYGQEKLVEAMKTPTGQLVTTQLSNVLAASDGYVDKYLPPMEVCEGCEEGPKVDGDNLLGQATALKTKLQRRMMRRALKNLVDVKVRSKEVLDRLASTLNVVEYARRNLDEKTVAQICDTVTNVQAKFWDVWGEITCEDEPCVEGEEAKTLERRSVLVARRLVSQLRSTISSLQANLSYLPTTARTKYDELYKFSSDLVASFKNVQEPADVSNWMVTQTRDTIGLIQITLTAMVDSAMSSAPFNWLVNKVGLQNMGNAVEGKGHTVS